MTKKFSVTIDNQKSNDIEIQEYEKKPTHTVLSQSPNTALDNDILIDAYIYYIPSGIETVDEEHVIINQSSDTPIEPEYDVPILTQIDNGSLAVFDGVVTVTIYNGNEVYYQQNIHFVKGHINTTIENTLPIGEYVLTIEYNGNKFLQPSLLYVNFNIEKRLAQCYIDDTYYHGSPQDGITIQGVIKDAQSNNLVNNCLIDYTFNELTYQTTTNNNGTFTISLEIPETNPEHCTTQIQKEEDAQPEELYEDESIEPIDETNADEAYTNTISHPLIISIDNESYHLDDIEVFIAVDKIPTDITMISTNPNDISNTLNIQGGVIGLLKHIDENVKYGKVTIEIPNFNYIKRNINVVDGLFNTDIDLAQIYQSYNDNDNELVPFDATNNINTSIEVYGDIYTEGDNRVVIYKNDVYIEDDDRLDVTTDEVSIEDDDTVEVIDDDMYVEGRYNIVIKQGDSFTIQAHVISSYDERVKDGMLLFSMYRDKDMTDLVHRYATDIDATGVGIFNFNTSMEGTYTLQVKYVGMFNYNSSYSGKYTVRVI